MIRRIADFFSKIVRRWLPDAFLFAVILTFAVFVLGMVFEAQTPKTVSPVSDHLYWGLGFKDHPKNKNYKC